MLRAEGTMRLISSTLLALLFLGCESSGGSDLVMRGAVPCPPGTGMVETWCDDEANCEFRVTTGGVYPCSGASSMECIDAATQATEACRGGGATDGGTSDGGGGGLEDAPESGDPCDSLCGSCPAACDECRGSATDFPACNGALATSTACIRGNACDISACESQIDAHTACTCEEIVSGLAAEADRCGFAYGVTCTLPGAATIAATCARAVETRGCSAFESTDCVP